MVKRYRGKRTAQGCTVQVRERGRRLRNYALRPRTDLRNHSPTGFQWGFGGSGPAQLALALCCDVLGDDRRALGCYQRVKWLLVAAWDQDEWEMTEGSLLLAIWRAEAEAAAREGSNLPGGHHQAEDEA